MYIAWLVVHAGGRFLCLKAKLLVGKASPSIGLRCWSPCSRHQKDNALLANGNRMRDKFWRFDDGVEYDSYFMDVTKKSPEVGLAKVK